MLPCNELPWHALCITMTWFRNISKSSATAQLKALCPEATEKQQQKVREGRLVSTMLHKFKSAAAYFCSHWYFARIAAVLKSELYICQVNIPQQIKIYSHTHKKKKHEYIKTFRGHTVIYSTGLKCLF